MSNYPSAERWARISQVLSEVLERDLEEREAYLDAACAGDPDLRREVVAYLIHEEQARALLDPGASAFAVDLLEDWQQDLLTTNDGSLTGRSIGPYRVAELIGRGGMGVVYRAKREDVNLQVAIKTIHPVLAPPEYVHRLKAESKTLARLDHPHIARFLDTGITGDGLPYVVMDYVEGAPIDHYCDKQRLSIHDRLRLFLTVCDAVQAAHNKLTVHRDLKPSNILVMDDGTVKLLDFGIAKMLDEAELSVLSIHDDNTQGNLGGSSSLTQTGRLMTWAYASPEQVNGEPATTSMDVYALGVLLYVLLTGSYPYDVHALPDAEAAQQVLEAAPPSPSMAAYMKGDTIQHERAVQRNTIPDQLSDALVGDLDAITLKALAKDPSKRYPSVEQLASDIRRYLNGFPVNARPNTSGYRTRKFIRRHRVGVAIGLIVLTMLTGAAIAYRAEARRATQEATKAEEVKEFLVDMFEAADPWENQDTDISARDLLGRGAEKLEAEFKDNPEIRAELLTTIGTIYRNLGVYEQSDYYLNEALALLRSISGEMSEDIAQSLFELGNLHLEQGDYKKADSVYRQALEVITSLDDKNHQMIPQILNGRGTVLRELGSYQEADSLFRYALAMRRSADEEGDSAPVAMILSGLAMTLERQGNLDESERLQREALHIEETTLGKIHPATINGYFTLAQILWNKGNYAEAESIYVQTLSWQRDIYGKHPSIAYTLSSLGLLLQQKGEVLAAEEALTEALAIYRNFLDDEHPEVLKTLNNMSAVYYHQRNYAAAESVLTEVIYITEKKHGREHLIVAPYKHNLATLRMEAGNYVDAEKQLRGVLSILEAHHGKDHPEIAMVLRSIAKSLEEQSKYDPAEQLYKESLAMHRRLRDEQSPEIALVLNNLGMLYFKKLKRYQEAEAFLRDALATYRASVGETWLTANARHNLGACLLAQERFREAEAALLEAYSSFQNLPGDYSSNIKTSRVRLKELYTAWDKPEEAAKYSSLD